ncbi:MAG TPA: GNAT family N-acetyltransferase [Stellaceae bacterium]|nr:GNAT family N-acetyltransferase [Stellaceae bacterium]
MLRSVTATITAITVADLDAAGELLRSTLAENCVDPNVIAEHYVADWIGSGAPVLGAWISGRLIGYAMLERTAGPAPFGVVALSVLRRYRRRGFGEQLMRVLLEEAKRAGEIGEVWLSVARDNLPARALYEKLCFVERPDPPPVMFVPTKYLTMVWRPDR